MRRSSRPRTTKRIEILTLSEGRRLGTKEESGDLPALHREQHEWTSSGFFLTELDSRVKRERCKVLFWAWAMVKLLARELVEFVESLMLAEVDSRLIISLRAYVLELSPLCA